MADGPPSGQPTSRGIAVAALVISILTALGSAAGFVLRIHGAEPHVRLFFGITRDAKTCPQLTVLATNTSTQAISLLAPTLGPVFGNTHTDGTGAPVTLDVTMSPVNGRVVINTPAGFPTYVEPQQVAEFVQPISPALWLSIVHGTLREKPLPVFISSTGTAHWNLSETPASDPSFMAALLNFVAMRHCKKLAGIMGPPPSRARSRTAGPG